MPHRQRRIMSKSYPLLSKLKTDHKAVVATLEGNVRDRTKHAEKRFYRRRTPDQHANILLELRHFDDSNLVSICEPQAAWDAFYQLKLCGNGLTTITFSELLL